MNVRRQSNCPKAFHGLSSLSWKIGLVYLDVAIVMRETFKDLEEAFQRLKESTLVLNPRTRLLFLTKVIHLDHIFGKDGIALRSSDPSRKIDIS